MDTGGLQSWAVGIDVAMLEQAKHQTSICRTACYRSNAEGRHFNYISHCLCGVVTPGEGVPQVHSN